MKNLLFFLLGVMLVGLTAFSPQGRQLFLLEPVAPKSTVILSAYHNGGPMLDQQAIGYLKSGYIIKCVELRAYNGYDDRLIGYMVLEKY